MQAEVPHALYLEENVPPKLYAHPLSSYCQKVIVALYEHATPFEMRLLDNAEASAELHALWPIHRFPVLVDAGKTVVEATIIIEHLDLYHPGPSRLIPEDPRAALDIRMMDRFFDNYIAAPQTKLVFDRLRPEDRRDPTGVDEAHKMLDTAYRWLDERMAGREWAAGERFSLADCAALPFLVYAHWSYAIDRSFADLHAYRRRLMTRPSCARVLDEARPYRHLFPLGIPADE